MVTVVLLMIVCDLVVAGDLVRYSCFSGWGGQTRAGSPSEIDYARRAWDANRTYRQLVVLVSFSDCDFSLERALALAQRLSYRRLLSFSG